MAYPANTDSFTLKTDGIDTVLAADINALQNSVVAIQEKVGIDNDVRTTTVDYLLTNTNSQDPGHTHTSASLSGILESDITDGTILARVGSNENVTGEWTFSAKTQINAGYGGLPVASGGLMIGAGGTPPTTVSFAFGANTTNEQLHFGTNASSSFVSRLGISAAEGIRISGGSLTSGTLGSSTGMTVGDGGATANELFAVANFKATGGDPGVKIIPSLTVEDTVMGLGTGTATPPFQFMIEGSCGQDTTTPDPPTAGVDSGATLFLKDTNSSAGSGGQVVFGAAAAGAHTDFFAAIKGIIQDGTDYTTGDLAFSLRSTTSLNQLSEVVRITDSLRVGIGSTAPGYRLQVSGASFTNGGTSNALMDGLDPLTDGSGGSIGLIDPNVGVGRGGQIVFGHGTDVWAVMKGLGSTNNDLGRGHIVFATRAVSTDTDLTEAMRILNDGNVCLSCAGITRTQYDTGDNRVLAVRGRGTGAGGAGIVELSTNESEGEHLLGGFSWADRHNTSGDTLAATINVVCEGSTANNRGSRMGFVNKEDGGALRTPLEIRENGEFLLINTADNSAPSAAPSNQGYVYMRSGNLYFKGASGTERLIASN